MMKRTLVTFLKTPLFLSSWYYLVALQSTSTKTRFLKLLVPAYVWYGQVITSIVTTTDNWTKVSEHQKQIKGLESFGDLNQYIQKLYSHLLCVITASLGTYTCSKCENSSRKSILYWLRIYSMLEAGERFGGPLLPRPNCWIISPTKADG